MNQVNKKKPLDAVEKIPVLDNWNVDDLKRLRLLAEKGGMNSSQYLLQYVRKAWTQSSLDFATE